MHPYKLSYHLVATALRQSTLIAVFYVRTVYTRIYKQHTHVGSGDPVFWHFQTHFTASQPQKWWTLLPLEPRKYQRAIAGILVKRRVRCHGVLRSPLVASLLLVAMPFAPSSVLATLCATLCATRFPRSSTLKPRALAQMTRF